MTMIRAYLSGAYAILYRDVRVYASYRTFLVTQVLTMIVSLSTFYFISRLVRVKLFSSPDNYFSYVVVGLVIVSIVTSVIASSPATMRQELVAGTFEKIILSPFGAVAGVAALMLFPLTLSMLLGSVNIAIAAAVFGLKVHWSTAWLAIPTTLLASLAFAPFGLFLSAIVLAFKQAQGLAQYLIAAIGLIAGLYFPVSLLPGWIRWASAVQPFTPAVKLLRHEIVGTASGGSALTQLLTLAGFAAVLIPITLWLLSISVEFGRRRGTIIEY